MTGRRERGKAETRRRVLEAARRLFQARGFEQTTVRAVADEAEVGVGTVLLHGSSKAELLLSLWVEDLQGVIDHRLATLPAGAGPSAELAHLLGGFFELYASHPELSRVYVRETLLLPPEQAAPYDALTAGFLDLLARRLRAGRVRAEPALLARAVFGLYLLHVAAFLRAPGDPTAAAGALAAELDGLLGPLLPEGGGPAGER